MQRFRDRVRSGRGNAVPWAPTRWQILCAPRLCRRVSTSTPRVEITSRAATVGTASGIAFGRYESHNGTRTELVIDPANGDLVGERDVATQSHDGISAGTVTGQTVVTRTLVDAVPPTDVNDAEVLDCNVATDGTVFCIR